jgi:hypothetical protein
MYLTHFFYENECSWANSYVYIATSSEDAIQYIQAKLISSVSDREWRDEVTTIWDLLRNKTNEDLDYIEIGSAEIEYDNRYISIKLWQDTYRGNIEKIAIGVESFL